MAVSSWSHYGLSADFSRNEVFGAIGDSVTVLPIVVAVAALTELSLASMLVWFGVFQVVWGIHYGIPLSVEPMKALVALLLAGALTTGEFLVAGLLAGVVLLLVGLSGTLDRVERYVGEPVVRGVQLAVALLLLETGLSLGRTDPGLAGVATAIALIAVVLGRWNLSALLVLLAGGVVASTQLGPGAGIGSGGVLASAVSGSALASLPPTSLLSGSLSAAAFSVSALEATVAQLAMTVGNAAIATSLLLSDFFDREVAPDELSASMGLMTLVAVPFGGLPMCHGSGGVAGKYAFGARTAVANVVLGVGYVAVAVVAVGLVAAYPLSMLGVVLVLIALRLGRASMRGPRSRRSDTVVVVVGLLGLLVNVGAAFVVGFGLFHVLGAREPAADD